ncbi:MAG: sigma-70 family RNA polymerase sigma factor [Actinobacteria bacterium]|nr:sigma-70 family RNA polymerase sigma factor [Actinomycetota bacterium]
MTVDKAVASSAVSLANGRAWGRAVDGDWSIIQQCRHGDVRAFAVLVEKYQDRLFNTTYRLCGNYQDARELTQEAFLRALKGINGFRSEAKFYTWLFRIALNLVRSHQRRAGRKHFSSLDEPDGKLEIASQAAALLDGDCADPAQRAIQAERNHKVLAALGRLAEQYRTVIVLRDIEGLNYEQIAQTLSLPVGTVKSRVHRGRLALKEYLADLMK